jgi:hypothetical protein
MYAFGDENYNILVGNIKGKTPVGKVRHRYEDNTKKLSLLQAVKA